MKQNKKQLNIYKAPVGVTFAKLIARYPAILKNGCLDNNILAVSHKLKSDLKRLFLYKKVY